MEKYLQNLRFNLFSLYPFVNNDFQRSETHCQNIDMFEYSDQLD